MVLPLAKKTERNLKQEKNAKIWTLLHFLKNFRFLNIEAKAFEAGNFLNIFKGFLGFSGVFSCKRFSYKKTCSYDSFPVI